MSEKFLTISASKEDEHHEVGDLFDIKERNFFHVKRIVGIPEHLDSEHAAASFLDDDHQLLITIPFTKEHKKATA